MNDKLMRLLVVVGAVLLAVMLATLPAATQSDRPIRKSGLLEALWNRGQANVILEQVRRRGVDFQMTAADEAELRQAGARDELIAAVRANYRSSVVATNRNTTRDTNATTTAPVNTPSPSPMSTPPTNTTATAPPRTTSRAPVRNQYGMELVWIPAGSFMMGSTNSRDEQPVHQVSFRDGFYMGRYEVTQAQWQRVMGTNPSNFRGDNLPVETVSWDDAIAFIARLNAPNDGYIYRLPTEAEWEYACRAGTTGDYAGDLEAMAWYGDNAGRTRLNTTEIARTERANYFTRIRANGNQTHPAGTIESLFSRPLRDLK